jgi:hypothetical protein
LLPNTAIALAPNSFTPGIFPINGIIENAAVIPADVVSHLGNGSSKAGAKQLYSMMDKVRAARTGTKKQGKQISPNKYLPA